MEPILFGLIILLGIFVVYKLLDRVMRLRRVGSYPDRHILITGCDSGFGHQLAKRLDSLGCQVFAGCLTEKGETELKKTCSERVHTISLDVTNHYSVRRAFELVNNKVQSAGTGGFKLCLVSGTFYCVFFASVSIFMYMNDEINSMQV